MDYRISLPVLGLLLIAVGLLNAGPYLLFCWLGICFLVLGVAHLLHWPRIFGKRADGSIPPWSWLAFLPLHAVTYGTWHLARLLSREDKSSRITDQLTIGRRPVAETELPDSDLIIDLTSGFDEVRNIRLHSGYISQTILDGSIPKIAELNLLLEKMEGKKCFFHCAQGHGRSGTVAIAFLLKTGKVSTVEEGLQLLQSQRPALDLGKRQYAFLQEYAKSLRKPE
jgi:hypothetical protein